MKDILISVAAIIVVLLLVVGAAWYVFGPFGSTSHETAAVAPTQTDKSKEPGAKPSPQAANPPGDNPASAKQGGEVEAQLQELEGGLAEAEVQWEKYLKQNPSGPNATALGAALTRSRTAADNLKKAVAGLGSKAANTAADPANADGKQPPLSPEQRTLVGAVSGAVAGDFKGWTIPLLLLLGLMFICTILQFFWLLTQSRKLDHATHNIALDVQNSTKEIMRGQESLVPKVTGVIDNLKDAQDGLDQKLTQTKINTEVVIQNLGELLGDNKIFGGTSDNRNKSGDGDDFNSFLYEQGRREANTGLSGLYDVGQDEGLAAKPHEFPVKVSEYVDMVKDNSPTAKPNHLMAGVLIEDSEGLFLLVKNPPGEAAGIAYAVPSHDYFQSQQDYVNNYAKYYECSTQSPGHVWIKKPAHVEKGSDGWRLAGDKGVLEVRQ